MKSLKRHQAFLQDVLREANRHKREVKLQHANADQINAISELSLNLLKKHIPVPLDAVAALKKHKNALRQLGKRKLSVKKRRKVLLNRKGAGFWSGLNGCFQACHIKKNR